MALRECFIPNCKNDSTNSPGKTFVRIREDLREKWCREAEVEYYKNYTQHCCEDHFDPREDLLNYYQHKLMNEEPKLKSTALLRAIHEPYTKSSELRRLLVQHLAPAPVKRNNDTFNIPNTPYSTSTINTIVAIANNGEVKEKTHDSSIFFPKNLYVTISKKSQSEEDRNDSSQKYENDSAGEEDNSDEDEVEKNAKNSEGGKTRSKRARLETSESLSDYTDEFCEFGEFVVDQLMLLDIDDARAAKTEIRAVLSKYINKINHCLKNQNKSKKQPATDEHFAVVTRTVTQINPVKSSVTQSGSKVNTARTSMTLPELSQVTPSVNRPMFSQHVNITVTSETQSELSHVTTAGPPVSQPLFSHVITARPSVTQPKFSDVTGPSVSQSMFSHVTTAGSSISQSGSQVNMPGPSGTQSGPLIGPLQKLAMLNVNPIASPMAPIGNIVVPTSPTPEFSLSTQLRKIVPETGTSVVTQSESSRLISALTSVSQPGTSSMAFSGTTVKTEPKSEPSESVSRSLGIKFEPRDSEGET